MSSRLQLTAHAQVLSRQHFAGPKINLMTAKCHSNELPSQAASWAAIFSGAALARWAALFFRRDGVQRIFLQVNGAVAKVSTVPVNIVFVARKFVKFLAWGHGREDSRKRPWLFIKLRVFHCHLVRQMVRVRARPAFDHVHGVTMRMGIVVNPTQLVLKSDRIDD